jgi:hypothetical protein
MFGYPPGTRCKNDVAAALQKIMLSMYEIQFLYIMFTPPNY